MNQDTYPDEMQGNGSNNPYGIQLYTVISPTGSEVNLMSREEADWYENQKRKYLSEHKFSNVSDLNDLDRLLILEVMIYRWSQWITQGFDYMMTMADPQQLQRNIKDYSTEVRQVKESLGIDKKARDKDKGEDLAGYINNLLKRAKQFGIHRNEQYEMAVTKIYELRSLVLTYDRCDDEEREELDLSIESIMDWVRDNMIEEWDELENSFRKNQKMWLKEL